MILLRFIAFRFFLMLNALDVTRGLHRLKTYCRTIPSTVQGARMQLIMGGDTLKLEERWNVANLVKHEIFEYPCCRARGLSAVVTIPAGKPIFESPIESSIAVAPDDDAPYKCLASAWGSQQKLTTKLALTLAYEWKLKGESAYKEYIDILPTPSGLSTPFHWQSKLLQRFPYRSLVRSVARQQHRWIKLHEQITQASDVAEFLTFERFVWAMEMVASRAFSGSDLKSRSSGGNSVAVPVTAVLGIATAGAAFFLHALTDLQAIAIGTSLLGLSLLPNGLQQLSKGVDIEAATCALLPIIDSCNHRNQGFNAKLEVNPLTRKFVISSCKQICSNEEVTISYGHRDNDQLLQYFGFVEERNPFDHYIILNAAEKMRLVLTYLEDGTMFEVKFKGKNSYSSELIRKFRALDSTEALLSSLSSRRSSLSDSAADGGSYDKTYDRDGSSIGFESDGSQGGEDRCSTSSQSQNDARLTLTGIESWSLGSLLEVIPISSTEQQQQKIKQKQKKQQGEGVNVGWLIQDDSYAKECLIHLLRIEKLILQQDTDDFTYLLKNSSSTGIGGGGAQEPKLESIGKRAATAVAGSTYEPIAAVPEKRVLLTGAEVACTYPELDDTMQQPHVQCEIQRFLEAKMLVLDTAIEAVFGEFMEFTTTGVIST